MTGLWGVVWAWNPSDRWRLQEVLERAGAMVGREEQLAERWEEVERTSAELNGAMAFQDATAALPPVVDPWGDIASDLTDAVEHLRARMRERLADPNTTAGQRRTWLEAWWIVDPHGVEAWCSDMVAEHLERDAMDGRR